MEFHPVVALRQIHGLIRTECTCCNLGIALVNAERGGDGARKSILELSGTARRDESATRRIRDRLQAPGILVGGVAQSETYHVHHDALLCQVAGSPGRVAATALDSVGHEHDCAVTLQ